MVLLCLAKEHNVWLQQLQRLPTKEECYERYPALLEYDDPQRAIRIVCQPIKLYDVQFWLQNVDWLTYGDDIVSVISLQYLWLFNFINFKQIYARFGISYTCPDKEGKEYYWKPLNQLEFLSRTFTCDVNAMLVYPKLKTSTLSSLLHWTRTNSPEQYRTNIQNYIVELALHDREYYERGAAVTRKIQEWLLEVMGIDLNLIIPSYELAREDASHTIRFARTSQVIY